MTEDLVLKKIENQLSSKELYSLAKELYNNYHTLDTNTNINLSFNSILSSYSNISIDPKTNTRKLFNELVNKHYHNEITIKANFINNVLSKTKNHVTIFELNSGKSRLDLCKVNGKSIAYEIKTDLDNLNRLKKQLNDYLVVFEKVYIICSQKRSETIEKYIPDDCGIYSYRITQKGKYIFKELKRAKMSKNIDNKTQLNLLTKKELEYIANIKSYNRNILIEHILKNKKSSEINLLFKACIKSKYRNQWEFLQSKKKNIYEIDYQWFFKNNLDPRIIYK